MKTYFKWEEVFGLYPSVIFRVPTADREDVYMSVTREDDDQQAVIEVDAEKFLALWRQEPYGEHAEISNGDPNSWKADYKFSSAEKGFSHGYKNPVPLAQVSCSIHVEMTPIYWRGWLGPKRLDHYEERTFGYVSFIDGITRTIWLLAHGAPYFPVKCDIDSAPHLQRLAGLPDGRLHTVEQLLLSSH